MAGTVKFDPGENGTPSPLTPELRDFIDSAIVPILVRKFLSSPRIPGRLAGKSCTVPKSTREKDAA
jgi:hypothetical protein